MAIYNGGLSIVDLRQTENTWSGQQTITSPSHQYGKVRIGVDGESGYINLYNQDMREANSYAHLDMHNNLFRVVKFTTNGDLCVPFQVDNEQVLCSKVYGAVFNDLADAIPVGEGDVLEAGYCYGFDGEHYTKTSEYMQKSYIGIHSDTYGFKMGYEEGKEKLNVAVSGFVLAYVDKEYEVGTPLTCTEDGYLTEIELEDKIKYPERVVATYWKSEPNEEWGSEDKKIKVKGRRWVKIK